MKSSRPYLARALYEWLLDNELTPYIVVDAEQEMVEVPRQFVQNGQIVLNLGPTAVRDLHMDNELIRFSARFSGKSENLFVPISALIALYARENGVGMVFGHEPVLPSDEAENAEDEEIPSMEVVDAEASSEKADDNDAERPPRKGRPSLRVIK
ncbi:stringent starvation protein B [Halomonas cupida]|uniref:Stringent starvation protein B n=1 Tax=Halomonas cupida TaxID=44933 RepID=A0A1M7A034_9GAMM|nr:ClpXP protease specificity-enhancing factor [Halomonas cupida]GEN22584.1 stringent starvation protein B [Halomonas cupida]SHL36077.1 stringent starvation protein B [Halomonas cupida]